MYTCAHKKKIEAGRNNSGLSLLCIIFSFIIYHVFQIIYCKHVFYNQEKVILKIRGVQTD